MGTSSFGISAYICNFQAHTLILYLLSVPHSSDSVNLSLTLPRRLLPAFCSLATLLQNVTLLMTNKGLSRKLTFVFFQERGKQFCLTLQSVSSLYFFFPKLSSNYLSLLNLVKTKPSVNLISTNAFTAVSHMCYTCFC